MCGAIKECCSNAPGVSKEAELGFDLSYFQDEDRMSPMDMLYIVNKCTRAWYGCLRYTSRGQETWFRHGVAGNRRTHTKVAGITTHGSCLHAGN